MKQNGAKLLIMEPFFDPRIPEKVSRDTHVPLVVVPTSVGAEDGIRTTFDLFDRIFAGLAKSLRNGG